MVHYRLKKYRQKYIGILVPSTYLKTFISKL